MVALAALCLLFPAKLQYQVDLQNVKFYKARLGVLEHVIEDKGGKDLSEFPKSTQGFCLRNESPF